MIWAIGDIHGCLRTLKALVAKIKSRDPQADIHLLGDLIDRGPESLAVLLYAREECFKVIMGNHELMALEHHDNSPLDTCVDCDWIGNGGNSILDKDIQKYMRSLPFFIHYPEVTVNGKSLFMAHSCFHRKNITINNEVEKIELCWNRKFSHSSEFTYLSKPVFCVFGHTEQVKIYQTQNFACIDTGCVYGERPRKDYGVLTAMSFPGQEVIQEFLLDRVRQEPIPSLKSRKRRVRKYALRHLKLFNFWRRKSRSH